MKKFLLVFVLLAFASVVSAEEVTLQWDANTEPDLAGYKVYYSTTSGPAYNGQGAILLDEISGDQMFNSPVDVGNEVEVTFNMPNGTWFYVVTAYDNEDPVLESDYSNEVSTFSSNGAPGQPGNVRIITVP